ncbi:MAG: hypothetical protein JW803_08825 [Endomicrobiales bacterium]|nr:hypothetical protein [Endomicrobiales bacterium]
MKIRLLYLSFALVYLTLSIQSVFADEKKAFTFGKHKSPWTWQKPFPEDIEDAIIETKPGKKSAYPKAVITKRGLRFFNENMQERRFVSYESLGPADWRKKASKGKRHIGVLANKLAHRAKGGNSKAVFKVFDTDGNMLWEKDISKVGYEMPSVSPDGSYIVCTGDPSLILSDFEPSILDRNGAKIKLFAIDLSKPLGRVKCVSFDGDGGYFTLVRIFNDINPQVCSLMKFARSGELIWEQKYYDRQVILTEMSDSGRYIFCVTTKVIEVYTGNVVQVKGHSVREKYISGVEYYLRMLDGSGNELWTTKSEPGNYSVEFIRNESALKAVVNGNTMLFNAGTGQKLGE